MTGWLAFGIDLAGALLLAAGLALSALGVFGLFRMPDIYTRIHAASKVLTVGSVTTLLGAALLSPGVLWLKVLGTTVFLLLTSPIGTFAVAHAAHRRRLPMAERTVVDELARDRGEEAEQGE